MASQRAGDPVQGSPRQSSSVRSGEWISRCVFRGSRGADPGRELIRYALDLTHERGRHKARVFAFALGISAADWRYLHDQILEALPEAEVRGTRITPFGVSYEVVVMIDGLNGATHPVVTSWIVERDRPPRLTSTWVDIP